MVWTSSGKVGWIAQMPAGNVHKGGIALGSPNGCEMANEPDGKAEDPKPKTQADGGGQCSVDDGDRARRTAQQDRFRQRAVHWCIEARN
jgi:hypothetical protein